VAGGHRCALPSTRRDATLIYTLVDTAARAADREPGGAASQGVQGGHDRRSTHALCAVLAGRRVPPCRRVRDRPGTGAARRSRNRLRATRERRYARSGSGRRPSTGFAERPAPDLSARRAPPCDGYTTRWWVSLASNEIAWRPGLPDLTRARPGRATSTARAFDKRFYREARNVATVHGDPSFLVIKLSIA